MHIGKNLKKLRQSRGLSQRDLAKKLGVTQKVVTTYETDQSIPTVVRLLKLSGLFNVSIEELIGVNKIEIKEQKPHLHGNSRTAKVQMLFNKLSEEEQRTILKQIKALVESKSKEQ